jgi:hypothetical protein
LQIDHNNRRYDRHDRSNNSQDYIDTYYYTGATWDVTGKTNGMLRFGIQDKSYDSPERTDSNNFSWDLEIEWLPLTYSTITATAGYRNEDAESEEGDVNTSRFSANWKHHWIPNVYSYIDLGYTRQDYTQSSRKDDTTSGSIKLGYEIYEQVDIVAGWSGQHNDSTGAGYTYKQNVWSINANFAF